MHPVLVIIFVSLAIELKNSSLPTGKDRETIYSSSHPSTENEYAIKKMYDTFCNIFDE
jgi:hypothetical protein